MNKKFLKKLFFLSSIVAPIAISTPLMLTSCANSNTESNQNQIQLSNKYSDSSINDIKNNMKEGSLSLSTTVNVDKDTSLDSIETALKEPTKGKQNFVDLLNNSEATKKGFTSETGTESKTIAFSNIIIQSFLSSEIKIDVNKPGTPANTIVVTVTNSGSWDVEGLQNIKFTLSIVEKTNVDQNLVELFSKDDAAKLVVSDNTSKKIILTNKLNPNYDYDKSDNDLSGIGYKGLDDIKKWLNGTSDATSNVLAKDKLLELFFNNVISEDFINKKPSAKVGTEKQNDNIVIPKLNVMPHSILTTNTDVTFTVENENKINDSGKNSNNTFEPKIVTINFKLKEGYKWFGLNSGLETSEIVFELTIPTPVLEEITLFSKWNNDFALNKDEFVFENNINQNYEPVAWKSNEEVLNWFKKKSNFGFFAGETNTEAELDESSFVKLFYEQGLVGDFTNVEETSSDKESKILSKQDILPHEIDDRFVTTNVKVEDLKKTKADSNSSEYGKSKKITISLTPKNGYGWFGISDIKNKTKTVKFILNVDLSEAVLPINNILGIIKPYEDTDKIKGENVYWFESNSNDLTFKYKNAGDSIKKLVSKSIFAGPEKGKKVDEAAKTISPVGFKPFNWNDKKPDDANYEPVKTKKESYINENFDLSQKENFELFSDFVLEQSFRNRYKDNDSSASNIFLSGKQLWYSGDNINVENVGRQIKCSVMVSVSEEQSANLIDKKLVKYDISFRLTPKNGGNWKGTNHKNPVDIDVSFVTPNFNTIKNDNETTGQHKLKEGETAPTLPFMTGNDDTAVMNFKGIINKNILGSDINTTTIVDENAIAKKFSSKSDQKTSTVSANDIKTDVVSKINSNIDSKELINNNGGDEETIENTFKITKENLSFLYVDKISNQNKENISYIYDKNINLHEIKVSPKNDSTPESPSGKLKADTAKEYTIDLTFKLNSNNKAKWYWGNWEEMISKDNEGQLDIDKIPQANKDIHLLLTISIPPAQTPAKLGAKINK